MLHEFFNAAQNPERQENSSQEEDQQALDAVYSLTRFLQDTQSFCHPELNELIAAIFPTKGDFPIDVKIVSREIEMMLVHDISTPYIRDHSFITIPVNFAEQVKNNPIEGLKDVVRVASLAQDALCYRYQAYEDKAPSITRSQAYQADLLLTLRQMADEERFQIVFTEEDQGLMNMYNGGILSLPISIRPARIPVLMRHLPNTDLN